MVLNAVRHLAVDAPDRHVPARSRVTGSGVRRGAGERGLTSA